MCIGYLLAYGQSEKVAAEMAGHRVRTWKHAKVGQIRAQTHSERDLRVQNQRAAGAFCDGVTVGLGCARIATANLPRDRPILPQTDL